LLGELGEFAPTALACLDDRMNSLFSIAISCQNGQLEQSVYELNEELEKVAARLNALPTNLKAVKDGAKKLRSFANSNSIELGLPVRW
jgi:hypothetical protein